MLLFLMFLFIGCSNTFQDRKSILIIESDDSTLEYFSYKVKRNILDIGNFKYYYAGGLAFKKNSQHEKILMLGINLDEIDFNKKIINKLTKIKNNKILIMPIINRININSNIVANSDSEIGIYGGEEIIFSNDEGRNFKLKSILRTGFPYLVDNSGKELTTDMWVTRKLNFEDSKIVAEQYAFLAYVYKDRLILKFRLADAYMNNLDSYPVVTWNGISMKPLPKCEDCRAVLWRKIVSVDDTKTWNVVEYKLLNKQFVLKKLKGHLLGKNYCIDYENYKPVRRDKSVCLYEYRKTQQ